jgi:hypothetical protein
VKVPGTEEVASSCSAVNGVLVTTSARPQQIAFQVRRRRTETAAVTHRPVTIWGSGAPSAPTSPMMVTWPGLLDLNPPTAMVTASLL